MSENNNKNNGKRRGDSFAVPGDENIVSNKGFLISLPKFKRGPANPLLESEKNKEKAAAQKKNADKKEGDRKENGERNERRDKGRQSHHKNNNNRNNNGNNNNSNNNNNNGNNRPEKREGQETRNSQPGGAPDRQKNKKFDKNRRRDDRQRPQDKGQRKENANPRAQEQQKAQAVERNEKKQPFDKRNKHKKHKKEKFVPMAPENAGESGELLQPIVDRTELLSGTPARKGGLFAGSSISSFSDKGFSKKKDSTLEGDEEEPRYVDRNRPLAEQIAEAEAVRNHSIATSENGVEVIGVRFREAGKIYYFAPGENKVKAGQAVIVETARGVEYGFCAIGNRFVTEDKIVPPLKPIIRIATAADTERYNGNKLLEESAAKLFREKVKKLGLEMSLVYVEYTFDNGKILFYFTAEGRVDFRELIKELAAAFKTRIELRQIGVRDEAKIVGGLGICGRPVCCKSFLGEFSQVSIKMAKDQNLFINSSKISGTCGRFMCCIRYEDETYQKEYEKTPKVDAIVETPEGRGVVVESNALQGNVKVLLDDKPDSLALPFKCSDVKLIGYLKKDNEKEEEIDQELLGD